MRSSFLWRSLPPAAAAALAASLTVAAPLPAAMAHSLIARSLVAAGQAAPGAPARAPRPVLLVVGGVVGLISRSSLPVRTLGVVMAYALLELRALWQLVRGGQDRDEFIRDLLERTHTV